MGLSETGICQYRVAPFGRRGSVSQHKSVALPLPGSHRSCTLSCSRAQGLEERASCGDNALWSVLKFLGMFEQNFNFSVDSQIT